MVAGIHANVSASQAVYVLVESGQVYATTVPPVLVEPSQLEVAVAGLAGGSEAQPYKNIAEYKILWKAAL